MRRKSQARGATFFFTAATHNRKPILCDQPNVLALRDAFRIAIKKHPFTINAFVLLPDHLHCIWTLPPNDTDFVSRWRQIKTYFDKHCSRAGRAGSAVSRSGSMLAIRENGLHERAIRDDLDYVRHIEYIHYNPVKHGLAGSPREWPHSTFGRYVQAGVYRDDWGADADILFDSDVGDE